MVFVTGGTGYLGRPLVERLLAHGRTVRVMARKGSEQKVPRGAEAVAGYELAGVDTVVHLVGVPRPSPWKGPQFRTVDLPLALASIEAALAASGMAHTILRPWYVLGPGHLWPHALRPLYALAERVPAWREGALRLGLVTRGQMLGTLEWAVENPPETARVMGVEEIRGTR